VKSIYEYADIPKEDIELIIVDNCSREPQAMFAKLKEQWGEDIVLIENTKNGGYGQGNNVGIRRATSPVILIMNPDVRLIDPFFAKPLKALQKNEKLIMYGMKQMLTPTRPSRSSFWFTTTINGYARTLLTGLCTRMDWYWPRWMYLSGSCFFVRKEMFQTVGLFDEDIFMYGEEDDIRMRLTKRYGYHIHYDTSIRYLHLTTERKPSVAYETKLMEASIAHFTKNGGEAKDIIRHYLQINNVLLMRAKLRRLVGPSDNEILETLTAFRQVIKNKLKTL